MGEITGQKYVRRLPRRDTWGVNGAIKLGKLVGKLMGRHTWGDTDTSGDVSMTHFGGMRGEILGVKWGEQTG